MPVPAACAPLVFGLVLAVLVSLLVSLGVYAAPLLRSIAVLVQQRS